jgi:hypothetical protein
MSFVLGTQGQKDYVARLQEGVHGHVKRRDFDGLRSYLGSHMIIVPSAEDPDIQQDVTLLGFHKI